MQDNKKILGILREIDDYTHRLNTSGNLPAIEKDLLLSKVRNLYDLILKIEVEESEDETSPAQKKKQALPHDPEIINEEAYVQKDNDVSLSEKPPKQEREGENASDEPESPPEVEEEVAEKEDKINVEEDGKIPERGEEAIDKQQASHPEIIADKFHGKKSMAENLAKGKSKNDISSRIHARPVRDIQSAIGVNDKFTFIRELFGGDRNLYHDTIQLLNNFDTFENAQDFLQSEFDWDMEDENVQKLINLLRRKYSNS